MTIEEKGRVDPELLREKAAYCAKNGLPTQAREFAIEAGLKGKDLWSVLAAAHARAHQNYIEQRDLLSQILSSTAAIKQDPTQSRLVSLQRDLAHNQALSHRDLRDYYESRIEAKKKP